MLGFAGLFFLTVWMTMERPTNFVPEEDQAGTSPSSSCRRGVAVPTEAVVDHATEIIRPESVIQVNGVDFEKINVSTSGSRSPFSSPGANAPRSTSRSPASST